MQRISIPPLGCDVFPIALGTWALGGFFWGGDENNAIAAIHQALDLGINLIDTAPLYGFGKTEQLVGKAIKQYGKRDKVLLATKCGLSWKEQNIFRDARKEVLLKEAEESLRRLKTDVIDLYHLHWPDPLTPFSETAEALTQLLKSGKIRAIGLSNCTLEQIKEFEKHLAVHAVQPPFNLFEKEVEKAEISYCLEKKIPVLGYGVLCRGLLGGRLKKGVKFRGDDLRSIDPKFQEPLYSQYLHCVEQLQDWAYQKHNRSLLALAFRFALDKGVIALWGPENTNHIFSIDEIAGWRLTQEDFREIDTILDKAVPNPIGAEFIVPPIRSCTKT